MLASKLFAIRSNFNSRAFGSSQRLLNSPGSVSRSYVAVVDGQFIALVAVHGGAAGVTGFDGVEILAAHILGGVGVLVVAMLHAFLLPHKVTAARKLRFELTLTYWHFVDFLWIYLLSFFTLLY